MVAAIVQSLAGDEVSFGHCFSNVSGLTAGDPVRIESASATIYCRLAWDLARRFAAPDRVALDSWQRAALGADDGTQVEVTGIGSVQHLPVADMVELRLDRWSEPPSTDHGAGLPDFLRSSKYLLYPGLRFTYRPLGDRGSGDYQVTSVIAGGQAVDVATIGDALTHVVQRVRGTADWPATYDDIGGLDAVIVLLRREIELPMRRPDDLNAIGISPPPGVLLYGPPGTGKTMLAKAVAYHSGARTSFISGPEVASQHPTEAERVIRAAFTPGDRDAPQLLIIDDIDYLTPNRTAPGMPTSLLGLVQHLLDEPRRPVVIATTRRRDDIDPAIRRLGRIGRQIPIPAPGEDGRKAILAIHTRWMALAAPEAERDELLTDLARKTAGFVGADLEALCHEAGRIALRRAFPISVLESGTAEAQGPLLVMPDDWQEALTLVTPSAIGGPIVDIPPTGFGDVAGLRNTVTTLTERLVLPLMRPGIFAEAGLRMERGVLLYGPPGTGKTLLARAIAHECGCRFIAVRGPELLTKWFGESEQAVRDLFDRARSVAPCVVFFDEVEAIARRRTGGAHDSGAADRVVDQLLAEIDGLVDLGQIAIIGATNDPHSLEPALLRPGRLGLHIEVPLPDVEGRKELFAMYLDHEGLPSRLDEYAELTTGMSGADIAMIAREARLNALRRAGFDRIVPVTHQDVIAGVDASRAALRQPDSTTAQRR